MSAECLWQYLINSAIKFCTLLNRDFFKHFKHLIGLEDVFFPSVSVDLCFLAGLDFLLPPRSRTSIQVSNLPRKPETQPLGKSTAFSTPGFLPFSDGGRWDRQWQTPLYILMLLLKLVKKQQASMIPKKILHASLRKSSFIHSAKCSQQWAQTPPKPTTALPGL